MATKSIGATGRDYATLALWLAYVNALALSAPEVGECYNDSQFTPSQLVFGGWTGDSSTNTITLKCAAGQSFRDNASVQSNALRYNQSNGVGVSFSWNYEAAFDVAGSFFIVDGLQISVPGTNPTAYRAKNSGGNRILRNSILQGNCKSATAQVSFQNSNDAIENCLILVTSTIGDGLKMTGSSATDVTVATTNGSSGVGITQAYSGPVVKNCAVYGFTTDYAGTANASSTNNATDKSSFGGTNYGGSGQVSLVGATEWQSVTLSSEDFRLKSTSAKLKDNGATVGPANDIAGTSRPQGSAYDIGCWELVAAAAGAFNPYYYREHVARAGG